MTKNSTECARPTCVFGVEPMMSEDGKLSTSEFCSAACAEWHANAAHNARCEPSPEAERQAQRLLLVNELLNLRDHPTGVTFFTTPTEPLGVTHGR